MTQHGRRRPNADGKRARKAAEMAAFVAAMGRKSSKRGGLDPNDRPVDPDSARSLRRMPATEFDRLVHDDES